MRYIIMDNRTLLRTDQIGRYSAFGFWCLQTALISACVQANPPCTLHCAKCNLRHSAYFYRDLYNKLGVILQDTKSLAKYGGGKKMKKEHDSLETQGAAGEGEGAEGAAVYKKSLKEQYAKFSSLDVRKNWFYDVQN